MAPTAAAAAAGSIAPSIEEGKLLSEALATVHTQLVQLKRCLVSPHFQSISLPSSHCD